MVTTVTQLVTESFYLSGIVSKTLQTVSGAQIAEGLQLLNSVLSFKTAAQRLIPYYREYQFNAVIGQQTYYVPDLILAESLTFNIGPVRYSMFPQGRREYFASPRIDNINSLPFQWHFERCLGGANIYLYFNPEDTYLMKLWGKFSLSNVTLNQDLELTLDLFFIEYLRYALAAKICQNRNVMFAPDNQKMLNEYESEIFDISPMDLKLTKKSSFNADQGLNWGDVNIGRGWRP